MRRITLMTRQKGRNRTRFTELITPGFVRNTKGRAADCYDPDDHDMSNKLTTIQIDEPNDQGWPIRFDLKMKGTNFIHPTHFEGVLVYVIDGHMMFGAQRNSFEMENMKQTNYQDDGTPYKTKSIVMTIHVEK